LPLPQDKLTNLVHESELEAQIEYELQRARRYSWDLSFVLAEPVLPDGASGDMNYPALRRLALTCKQVMRSVDKGVRSGSGILYILPETPGVGADVAVDKIRQQFSETDVPNPITGEAIKCGVRAGRYTYEASGDGERQGAVPAWRDVMVALRGNLE
jgi:hypothetical protein